MMSLRSCLLFAAVTLLFATSPAVPTWATGQGSDTFPGYYGTETGCRHFQHFGLSNLPDVKSGSAPFSAAHEFAMIGPRGLFARNVFCKFFPEDETFPIRRARMRCRGADFEKAVVTSFTFSGRDVVVDIKDHGVFTYNLCGPMEIDFRDLDTDPKFRAGDDPRGSPAACYRYAKDGALAVYRGVPLPGEPPEDQDRTFLMETDRLIGNGHFCLPVVAFETLMLLECFAENDKSWTALAQVNQNRDGSVLAMEPMSGDLDAAPPTEWGVGEYPWCD